MSIKGAMLSVRNLVAHERMLKLAEKTMEAAPKGASWHLGDAQDMVVGRLASRIAPILQGKHKPSHPRLS